MTLTKKKTTIAIDIDDVLSRSAEVIIEYSNNRWGTSLTIDDFSEDFTKLWQVDDEEMRRRFDEYIELGMPFTYEHDSSAVTALGKMKANYHLIIITSRSTRLKKDTISWVNKNYPGVFKEQHIYFAGFWDESLSGDAIKRTKGELVKSLNADYLIDDQLKHCLSVSDLGIDSILFGNYAWNRTENLPSNVKRSSDWTAIERYFDDRK